LVTARDGGAARRRGRVAGALATGGGGLCLEARARAEEAHERQQSAGKLLDADGVVAVMVKKAEHRLELVLVGKEKRCEVLQSDALLGAFLPRGLER
jgi:hypothetical protein